MPPEDPPSPIRDSSFNDSSSEVALLNRAMHGDQSALGRLIAIHRERLKLLVEIRLDKRLRQRMDDSDVLQELFLRIHRQTDFESHLQVTSAYVWLRRLAIWTLGDLQRKHLGVQGRDARRELSLGLADSCGTEGLAKLLVDSMVHPLDQMVLAERLRQMQTALERLGHLDREILVLRHGEQLTRSEAAEVLGITVAAAAKRYLRALESIRAIMKNWDSSCAS